MTITDLGAIEHAHSILRYVAQQRAELADMEDEAKAIIKEHMGDAEELVLAGRQVVTWKWRKSTSVNMGALKKMHPEIVEAFTTEGKRRYFQLMED